MKTARKALLLTLCAVVLVAATIMGTLAYLTDQDQVVNTFSAGKVVITLDEAPTDVYGELIDGQRRGANEYKLMPGHNYMKDPTIHVDPVSELSYLFVKVENGILNIEGAPTIAQQMADLGWKQIGSTNIYYLENAVNAKSASNKEGAANGDFVVFETFTVDGDKAGNQEILDYSSANITITAYAIQADGFTSATEAWEAAKLA